MAPAQAPATLPDDTLLRREAALALTCGALLLGLLASAATSTTPLDAWFSAKALALYALGAGCVWRALAGHAPHRRFGAANHLTVLRLALVAMLAALLGEPQAATPALAWAVVVLATVTAVLDALDGPLARRSGQCSAFGARFDMETDALLTLVLSVLVWQFGKAGAWVLAAGLMRYAFVLAAWRWPWLDQPLPPSWRRKAVCVAQITTLIVCLGPVIAPRWSAALAAASLALLSWSFAVDILWLARHRPCAKETPP